VRVSRDFIESLLKVSAYRSTKQFASRAPKLAEMLGHELTGAGAEALYKGREYLW
jgi:hypothetical protein